MKGICQHCGLALGASPVRLISSGTPTMFCCAGCAGAFQWLQLEQAQVSPAPKMVETKPPASCDTVWKHAELIIDAIHCASCASVIEHVLQSMPPHGVSPAGALEPALQVRVDVSLRMVHLRFDASKHRLEDIKQHLANAGYPVIEGHGADAVNRKQDLKALFLAGFGSMQAMMFGEPLYWRNSDLPVATAQFFAWLSAFITFVVLAYSARKFFQGARREWLARRPAMDTLVCTSIVLTTALSLLNLLGGSSEVYFDAIAMFVFVLLAGRMLESALMQRARSFLRPPSASNASQIECRDGRNIAASELRVGLQLRARKSEVLVADGQVLEQPCQISSALLDGESCARTLQPGMQVYAGSQVVSDQCIYQVQAVGDQTQLAQIARLAAQAMRARLPNADRAALLATRFTGTVMLLALLSAIAWSLLQADRALLISLSVLTVACPCALALALPVTRAMAHARLQAAGALLMRPDALERLSEIDSIVLDKTGTLTVILDDDAQLANMPVDLSGALDLELARSIAGALERGSTHPYARALRWPSPLQTRNLVASAGLGISAEIIDPLQHDRSLGHWHIGASKQFESADRDAIVLQGPLGSACFRLEERLVDDATSALAALQSEVAELSLLSGDHPLRVQKIAQRLAIQSFQARMRPEQKRDWIQARQAAGKRVMMVGDGINDAIALASADLSVSFVQGNALAYAQADILLSTQKISNLPMMFKLSKRAQRICAQNLWFAKGYNVVMIPCAMMGWIGPTLAALGMGLSSLLVTLNAARLLRAPKPLAATTVPNANRPLMPDRGLP